MRRIDRPVRVITDAQGRPARFVWRGRIVGPLHVEDTWSYTEPWWDRQALEERRFWRVQSPAGARFDLCLSTDGTWRLHRVFD